MRRSKIFGLSLLSTLLIFSIANVSQAAPPSYVGVSKGSTYTWVASANMANVNATVISLIGQDNWTFTYAMLDDMVWNMTGNMYHIDNFLGAGFRLKVLNVSDEMMFAPIAPGAYIIGEMYGSYEPGVWTNLTYGPSMIAALLDPTYVNNTNFMYFLGMGGPPLVMSKGFPYLTVTPWLSAAMAGMPPIYGNITFTGLSNGFEITVLAEFLEWGFNQSGAPFPLPTFSDVEITVTWNENGILDLATVSYMDLTLVSFKLIPGEEEIPGFVIPVFLGVSAATIIGLISIIKKKKL